MLAFILTWRWPMTDILVRNVPDTILEPLKKQSVKHRRSLQQEIMSILEGAAAEASRPSAAEVAAIVRARLAASGQTFTDSVDLIREDRER